MIKLAPFFYLFSLVPIMIWRYILLVVSVLKHRGASSKLRDNVRHQKGESVTGIVWRSWKSVWRSRKSLVRKRRYIQRRRIIGIGAMLKLMRAHKVSLIDVIFK